MPVMGKLPELGGQFAGKIGKISMVDSANSGNRTIFGYILRYSYSSSSLRIYLTKTVELELMDKARDK